MTPSDAFRHVASRPHEPLRTFHPRRAPLSAGREDALARLWPRFGFSVHDPRSPVPLRDGALDTRALFGRSAPVVLEIGSGMGETTAAMAAADPARDYLAVEAHLPGVAHLLGLIDRAGLTNVRIAHGDALDLVRSVLPEESLDAVHAFFPDPWPKARHHKRRLVQPSHVALLRSRLRIGGTLHCATDWVDYADAMLEVLTADPFLENTTDGFAPHPAHRPVTKFEQRGLDLGHEVRDLVFRRVR
ncbi:tRNA (guanosine(46)-N7)-methyltransferase TrmB [Cellulomonas fengjieae]|uniref:tRNA (guanine-N(7)-)-methyltransferase n=1 Tax=Cellulomonas fengjieae TaxID=2819978 RepID=A0ABS3SHC4_9CELL|nr:tRNA (guanosine(46)-N7)-methyltransferase TrmB [Cellulomonas fengjieae]MBO3085148.1 tRNA (guanosine(46)-N7)-methyltransferase TrmB [Cellulomonas fengjieae]QVI66275.1 tRNA (guanosine(46)-N7)-methyltransferase TrmB [Cellulomonas fengjieae]